MTSQTSTIDMLLWIYGQGNLPNTIRCKGETTRVFFHSLSNNGCRPSIALEIRLSSEDCVTCHKVQSCVVQMAKEHVEYSMAVCVSSDTKWLLMLNMIVWHK